MDSWTEKQLQQMKIGGNTKCKEFLSKHGIDMTTQSPPTSIKDKYDSPPAELYRQILLARVEGRPEPTELPTASSNTTNNKTTRVDPSRLKGFGSSPPPKQNNDDGWLRAIMLVGAVLLVASGLWYVVTVLL